MHTITRMNSVNRWQDWECVIETGRNKRALLPSFLCNTLLKCNTCLTRAVIPQSAWEDYKNFAKNVTGPSEQEQKLRASFMNIVIPNIFGHWRVVLFDRHLWIYSCMPSVRFRGSPPWLLAQLQEPVGIPKYPQSPTSHTSTASCQHLSSNTHISASLKATYRQHMRN